MLKHTLPFIMAAVLIAISGSSCNGHGKTDGGSSGDSGGYGSYYDNTGG